MVDAVLELGDRDLGGQRKPQAVNTVMHTAPKCCTSLLSPSSIHTTRLRPWRPQHWQKARPSVTPSSAKRGPAGPMTPSSATWVTIAVHGCGPLWLDRPGWPY